VASLLAVAPAAAQPPARPIENPPEARIQRGEALQQAAAAAGHDAGPAMDKQARLRLKAAFIDASLNNPAAGQREKVRLRGYLQAAGDADTPFIAPTIRVFPGETVRLALHNALDPEPGCDGGPDVNVPHCFNTTNLHAHGLWVSPAGNSDNVSLAIRPGVTFDYEFNIPAEHPAGTFWYHPHRHGSTTMQVGSGMAGALIVRGNRLPTASAPGDIDTLLRHPDGAAFAERVLVFQQIAYACRDASGAIKKAGGRWVCDQAAGDVGKVDLYDDIFKQATAWVQSGRFTSINGRTVEPFKDRARAGRIERWRMIHAGVRAGLRIRLQKRLPAAGPAVAAWRSLEADEQPAWIQANCDSARSIPHWEMAADGITRAQADPRDVTFLQPGYRSDILVVFPEAGDYCLIDEEAPEAATTVNGVPTSRRLLTVVTADPGVDVTDSAALVRDVLKAAAQAFMPADVRASIVGDLDGGLRLSRFEPHPGLLAEVPTRARPLLLSLTMGGVNKPSVGKDQASLQQYAPARIDHQLVLDDVEDWELKASGGAHPFHIHVNPFQIVSAIDGTGRDLTAMPGSQYERGKGVWKDTLMIESGATITVRSRYRRYIGAFVLHCHILDHEDRGMMQNVEIVLPDGRGGAQPGGHGHPFD
jgi:FtsP/CotA-like multicopper oxidase with cupredoxin domain